MRLHSGLEVGRGPLHNVKYLRVAIILSTAAILGLASPGNSVEYFLKISGNRPFGIAFDRRGCMYLVTAPPTGNGTLSRVTPEGKITELAILEGTFIGPGICVDSQSNVLVTVGDKLLRISPEGKTTVIEEGFSRCFDVKVDKKGHIYVADDGSGIIYRTDLSKSREVFYRSDTAGSFLLTGMCFDSRCENLFVRAGRKLLKFQVESGKQTPKPEVVMDGADMFYLCVDTGNTIYASTIKNVIKIDGRRQIQTLARNDLNTSIGIALGGEGFDKNSLYVAVADGIVRLPIIR